MNGTSPRQLGDALRAIASNRFLDKRIADLEAGLPAAAPRSTGGTAAHVTLDMADATELEQLLDSLTRWIRSGHDCLGPSLARFLGTDHLGFEVSRARDPSR